MSYRNFSDLVQKVQAYTQPKRIAVVAAEDHNAIEAVLNAADIVTPVLIGNREKISLHIRDLGKDPLCYQLIEPNPHQGPARIAVELLNSGQVDMIMKGKIETATLLKDIVDKESRLRTGTLMSHLALLEVPGFPKLIGVTDGGMVTYPDLAQKKQIVLNTVNALTTLGYSNPKIAILTAVEQFNPKMLETIHAAELKRQNLSGEIPGCIIEGPISYDLAMSKESARIKGYESPHCGDFDVLLVPNMVAGNILSKALMYSAGAKMAGIIIGAKVPIVLTSRGATAEEKYLSLVLAAGVA